MINSTDPTPKKRVDGQVTGLSGEFFVAAELLKRGLQTSITFGNAKSIDLFAHNPVTGRNFTVQIKSLRKVNYFPIKPDSIDQNHVYVFVLLNKPGEAVQYFVVPGVVLKNEGERFGNDFKHTTFPSIHPKKLIEFADVWQIFEEAGP